MPYQPTRNLTAYIMGDAFKEAMNWAPSLLGLVKFGGLKLEMHRLIRICLDAYIKGAAIGYTFKDKYDLIVPLIVRPDKAEKFAEDLKKLSQERISSYDSEITSVIDFFITTELTKDKMSFDDFIRKAKNKIKIDHAGPRLKQTFEEGTTFGATQPGMVTKIISPDAPASRFDWDQAKLNDIDLNLNTIELNLDFLKKWAVHNMGLYCREFAPELIEPLNL